MKLSKSTLGSAIQLRYSWAIFHSNEVQFTICWKYKKKCTASGYRACHIAVWHTQTHIHKCKWFLFCIENINKIFIFCKKISIIIIYQMFTKFQGFAVSFQCGLFFPLPKITLDEYSNIMLIHSMPKYWQRILTSFFLRFSYRHRLHGTLTNKCIKWKQNIKHKMKKPKPTHSVTQHLLGLNHFIFDPFVLGNGLPFKMI